MTQILSQIKDLYLCRDQQLDQLYEYLCHNWSTILVYGSRGTAKTSCVNALVNKLNLFHAFVNCLEVFNNKMIFESILSQLNDKNEDIDQFIDNNINSLSDFIHYLKLILTQFVINYNNNQNNRKEFNKCVIVFDSFEHLFVNKSNDLIEWLTNLEELTENICPIICIFISRHSLDWFCRFSDHPLTAIQINFNNYSTQQMSQILLNDCPLNYTKDFYQNYVNLILKTLTQFTRNFSEIRNFCLRNFTKYTEPITTEEMTTKDSAKLYKRFQPILLELIDQIPLKVVNKSEENVVLPDCVQYLLIAGYLSSYNSVKTDKKYFVKYEGKRKERKKRVTTEEKERNGPKAFTFERMFHIYKSILHLNAQNSDDDDLTDASNKLFSQIEQLVSLKLLHKIYSNNKNNCISSLAKFQISNSVTLELIKELSRNLNFNINAFLE